MTLLRKIEDGTYPVSEAEVRAANPNVSFPSVIDEATLNAFGYEVVFQAPRPTAKRYQSVQEVAPVKSSQGKWEQTFEVVDIEFADDEAKAAYLESWKAEIKATITAKRYSAEVSGVALPNGVKVKTDRESQSQLSAAYSSLKNGLIVDTDWKAEGGVFVKVGLADIEPIAKAVAEHVRACFAAEKSHLEAVDLIETFEDAEGYDVNAGWPGSAE